MKKIKIKNYEIGKNSPPLLLLKLELIIMVI